MSVAEPDDELFRALEEQMSDVEIPEMPFNVTDVPAHALALLVADCDRELEEIGELHTMPRTQRARDIHSRRGALLIEMARRGLR